MPTYRFKCNECEFKFDVFGVPMAERDKIKPHCENCNSINCKRIMPDIMRFSFAEDLDRPDGESTKPDSYWENAEKIRLENIEKRRAERYQKVMDGDPVEVGKIRNMAENEQRLGQLGDDDARLDHAKELRKLIGEDE